MNRSENVEYLAYGSFFIDYIDSGEEVRKPLEHFHDTYELAFFVRADIDIFVKDTKYSIRDGDWLLINSNDIHRIFYHPRHHYTRYVLQFKRSFISDLLVTLGLEARMDALQHRRNKRISLDLQQRLKIEGLYRTLLQLYEQHRWNSRNRQEASVNRPQAEEAVSSDPPEIKLHLALLLLEYEKLCSTAAVRRLQPADESVREVIAYLDEHYMYAVQLEELERQFGKSKFTICRQFSRVTQFTIVEYLHYRRVLEAQKRLLHSEQSLMDIAFDCGFHNAQHFYRIFKKICGQTPQQYRKEARRFSGDA